MRIGKWVPVYHKMLPLPQRMALAFGIRESATLYMAPMHTTGDSYSLSGEILVSPVPFESWRSTCRLSVRLKNHAYALERATRFLRDHNINILISEGCATYEDRAHWDAICDVRAESGFQQVEVSDRRNFAKSMAKYIKRLNMTLSKYIRDSRNAPSFLSGFERHAQFSTMSGLNDAAFRCDLGLRARAEAKRGGVELPQPIVDFVSRACQLPLNTLPPYAMITGNTRQRYLRIYFMRDYENMFRAVLVNKLDNFAGGGIGTLQQILACLPSEINLLKLTSQVRETGGTAEKSVIELIGHWTSPTAVDSVGLVTKQQRMKAVFESAIESLELMDTDGRVHREVVKVEDFGSPEVTLPRVFIAYSTSMAKEKLEFLSSTLWSNGFMPVLGTEFEGSPQRREASGPVPDIVDRAFHAIGTCVALISLQTTRSDFLVKAKGTTHSRYILPPWAVAEEVYARYKAELLVIRLRDFRLDEPRYNRHIESYDFNDKNYQKKAVAVVEALNKYRESDEFQTAWRRARQAMFRDRYLPAE